MSGETVLLVEDEQRLLMGLSAIVKRAGYRVLSAPDGSEGLRLARLQKPDIIVSDVMMPPPDGFELRRLLSEDPETAAIPFIFLTARSGINDRLKGIEGGADDYITKPFDSRELLARLASVLRRQEIARQKGLEDAIPKVEEIRRGLLETVGLELRKPVASLLATLKPVMREEFQSDPKRLEDFLESATEDASRMEAMVSDLGLLVRLEEEGVPLQRRAIPLEENFHQAIEKIYEHWTRFEFKDIDLSLSVDSDEEPMLDAELFRRSISHLMDNACKFSPDGGRIDLRYLSLHPGGCRITISDQGPGVPAHLREKVFEAFCRGAEDTSRENGLGIGLSIARLTARAYGGDARILDTDSGCTIQFEIAALKSSGEAGSWPR